MSRNILRKKLQELADGKSVATANRYHKERDQKARGTICWGIRAPQLRQLVKEHPKISLTDAGQMLRSEVHEERSLALLILVRMFTKSDDTDREKIYELYLKNRQYYRSWDLVDVAARDIVGAFLFDRDRAMLFELARADTWWERRIAVVATQYFIKRGDFKDMFKLAELLLNDDEDLIHKAVGWMLREIGDRDRNAEEEFLSEQYQDMPRTMLRYAIEKFPEQRRFAYLQGKVKSD